MSPKFYRKMLSESGSQANVLLGGNLCTQFVSADMLDLGISLRLLSMSYAELKVL